MLHAPAARTSAILIAILSLYAVTWATGHTGHKEALALLPIAIAPALHRRHLVAVAHIFFGLALIGLIVALFQPERVGTHRWLTIPGLGTAQMGTPVAAATVLAAGTGTPAWVRILVALAGGGTLVLSRSFSAAGLALTPLFTTGSRRARVGLAVTIVAALAALLATNPNRARRISEHYRGQESTYQVRQLERVWDSAEVFHESEKAIRVHLPAKRDDMAFVDIVRRRGKAAGVVVLMLQGLLLWLLFERAIHHRKSHPMAVGGAVVLTACCLAHLAVNTALLPPTGVPMPFIGRGAAAWFSFAVLVMPHLARPHEELPTETPSRSMQALRWISLTALAGAAAFTIAA